MTHSRLEGPTLMFRRLRVLAAFFMVPVVVFVTPQTAAAATGEWVTVDFSVAAAPLIGDSAPGTVDTVDCTATFRPSSGIYGNFLGVGSNGYCYGLPDVTWGFTQDGEAGSAYKIGVQGLTGSGSTCEGDLTSTLGDHPANGTLRVAGKITSGDVPLSSPDCSVTEVCLTLDSGRSDCVSVDIPAPDSEPVEEPTGTADCAFGTGWAIVVSCTPTQVTYRFRSDLEDWLNAQPAVTAGVGCGGVDMPGRKVTDTAWTSAYGFTWYSVASACGDTWTPGREISIARPPAGQPASEYQLFKIRYNTAHTTTNYRERLGDWGGWLRVAAVGSTTDKPPAPTSTTPPPPPPVEPDVENPTPIAEPTDDVSWLGAIWALLRTIWQALVGGFNAVVGAVKSVTTAVLDGVRGLFLPSDGYIESKWSGVEAKFDGTSPGKYLDAVTGLDPGTVAGCEGLPLNVELGGGVAIDEHIGAACSGTMATAASITRAVLTAVFAVAGAIACVRAVGAGLGWDPGLGRGNVS